MKSYRELMGEMVVMDLPKARKNRIFKKEGEEKKIEHLISRLMLSNFTNLKWRLSSDGYELSLDDAYRNTTYYNSDTILQTLEAAMKKLRIKA
jgi:di/tripeptidase